MKKKWGDTMGIKNIHGGDIYSYDGILDFSANINPLGAPENVMKSMEASLRSLEAYPDYYCRELIKKISEKLDVKQDFIICGNGAADILFTLAATVRPKKVLLIAPGFAEYEESLYMCNATKNYYMLKEEYEYTIDEEYLDWLTSDLDMAFICSPNNPTGKTVNHDLLLKIIQKCKKNHIFLVLDECFNDFLEDAEYHSMVKHISTYSNVFILKSFTKMYAIAGVRLGYGLCSDKNVIEGMYQHRQPWSVSTIAQAAGISALDEDEHVTLTKKRIREERNYIFEEFNRLGIPYIESEVNYILFQSNEDLKENLLKRGILIRDCSNYRNLKKGFFRIAVKDHKDNLKLIHCLEEMLRG